MAKSARKRTKKVRPRAARSAARAAIATTIVPGTISNVSGFAVAAMVSVTFNCSNPNCIVGITAAHVDIAFRNSETVDLPIGSYSLFYRVQGAGQFAVTATGAQLSHPIAGTAPDGGVRAIQVP